MRRTKYPFAVVAASMKKAESKLLDTDIMPFGMYHDKGIQMANIPAWYLLKLYDSGKCFGAIKNYIQENLEILKAENAKENAFWRANVTIYKNK